jgi:hypothetical protein
MRTVQLVVLLLLALLPGCAGTAPRPGTPASPGGSPAPARPGEASATPLDRALRAALAENRWGDLRIDAECRRPDGSYPSATVFASGVGIWNRERQLVLSRAAVRGLLEAFEANGFTALAENGGAASAPPSPPAAFAPTLTCSVALHLGGTARRVNQLAQKERFDALERLAAVVLDTCEQAGRDGATAASLADGLRKVAAGELAPELLRIEAQRKGEEPDATGWLLFLDGGTATVRDLQGAAGYGEPRELALTAAEIAALAGILAGGAGGGGVDGLPANLYAAEYTDLAVEVLNRRAAVQARRFAGLSPATHGARQQDFDRLLDALATLRDRVRLQGKKE